MCYGWALGWRCRIMRLMERDGPNVYWLILIHYSITNSNIICIDVTLWVVLCKGQNKTSFFVRENVAEKRRFGFITLKHENQKLEQHYIVLFMLLSKFMIKPTWIDFYAYESHSTTAQHSHQHVSLGYCQTQIVINCRHVDEVVMMTPVRVVL